MVTEPLRASVRGSRIAILIGSARKEARRLGLLFTVVGAFRTAARSGFHRSFLPLPIFVVFLLSAMCGIALLLRESGSMAFGVEFEALKTTVALRGLKRKRRRSLS
jgi:hypothetical protein